MGDAENKATEDNGAPADNSGPRQTRRIGDDDTLIATAKVKPQEFFVSDPELWFLLLESTFAQARITSDNSKYHIVVASLTQSVADRVKDLLKNPPAEGKYDKLKQRLIKDFAESESAKIKRLLSDMQLGDQKPSALLQRMRSLAGDSVGETYIKHLWVNQLPSVPRTILLASKEPLDNLAVTADDMIDGMTATAVNSAEKSDQDALTDISKSMRELMSRIDRIESSFHKSSNNSPSTSSRANQQQENDKQKRVYDYCYFHWKYGADARDCKKPCKYRHPSEN